MVWVTSRVALGAFGREQSNGVFGTPLSDQCGRLLARSGGASGMPCKPMWAPLGRLWDASWRGLAGYSGAPHPANQCGRLWGASGAPLGRFGEVWRRSPGNSGRTWRETLNPKLRGGPGGHKDQRSSRASQGVPGLPKAPKSNQKLPGAPRSSQRSQNVPEAPRGSR